MINEIILEDSRASLNKLLQYIESNEYKGYDPYDTLSSKVLNSIPNHKLKYIITQLQKRNPINIRPLLGIKPAYHNKAMALLLRAYSILLQMDEDKCCLSRKDIEKSCDFFYSYLLKNSIDSYDGLCWSVNFNIATKIRIRTVGDDPSAVLACFVGEAMYEYYKAVKKADIVQQMEKIAVFILKYIPHIDNELGICYSYTTKKKDITFNANMHVAQFFSELYELTKKKDYYNIARKCVDFTIAYQQEDGGWVYSVDVNNPQKVKKQYDFHQGFVIDSLAEFIKLCRPTESIYNNSLQKALQFYKKELFRENGRSLWRYPIEYPIDIHNQAQGIITFSNQIDDNDMVDFAKRIAEWTIKNMQDKKGYFYYQKRKMFTNKIPYLRWSESWMAVALATLIKNNR